MKLAVTGSSGFVGRAVVEAAGRRGIEVVRLQRSPEPGALRWSLGEALPVEARDCDGLVHLASATLGAASPARGMALDLDGARLLVDELRRLRRQGRGPRLVFVSSQSADPHAANLYGRSKWAIEAMLTEPDEIIVRPGLVWSDPPVSVYAALARLARLPAVPVVKGPAGIHPIQVDDLADSLLDIAGAGSPERIWRLGAAPGLTLSDMLAAIALGEGRRAPILVPLPRVLIRLAARAVDLTFRPAQSMLERVDGLIALKPMDVAPSLARLGRPLRPFQPGGSGGLARGGGLTV